jgi:hypothetical protein
MCILEHILVRRGDTVLSTATILEQHPSDESLKQGQNQSRLLVRL